MCNSNAFETKLQSKESVYNQQVTSAVQKIECPENMNNTSLAMRSYRN